MSNKVALHTLGCKLNFSETSTIGNQFLSNGYEIVDFWKSIDSSSEKADIYIFNTCSVTENAEKECRQLVRRVLRRNPSAFVAVTGCYAQLRPEEISKIEGVDVVLGSREKFKLFSLIENFHKNELACIYVSPAQQLNEFGAAHSTDADSRTRAYFKIQDGCDYKCSFCTIPLARGKSRSMSPDELINEFTVLVEKGYKEIILTGVNVGDYGKAFNTNLYKILLRMVNAAGDFRIRISSIEPNLLTDEILELTYDSEKMCKHFHIPLQSGSTEVLRLMQRRYKRNEYSKLIYKIKEKIPELGIGVDVITGFPGESKENFNETYELIKELPVSYLHVFTYSERPDTKAIRMPDHVEMSERRDRTNMLRILSDKKKHAFYTNAVGKEYSVLFEAENEEGMMKGFTSNYIRIEVPFDSNLVNKFSNVVVTEVNGDVCSGEIKGKEKSIDLIAC